MVWCRVLSSWAAQTLPCVFICISFNDVMLHCVVLFICVEQSSHANDVHPQRLGMLLNLKEILYGNLMPSNNSQAVNSKR